MGLTYTNPVFPGYFADPFVLRLGGEYFAYGTREGAEPCSDTGASIFAVLHSRDLANWTARGAALAVADADRPNAFWAPEVAVHGGKFYLYYSTAPAGHDELHRLRVATAASPLGPFRDAGPVLPDDDVFSIDAHPFQDPRDGQWYLFFARDYFDGRTGTGLAVVPLAPDLLRAAGRPSEALKAHADWQIYERARPLYGKTWDAWHTVEGPCVVAHNDRYYCFYSGGNWQTENYGVSYAVADHPLGPWRHAEGTGPVVLRQVPGRVLGPGHNSYTIGPDGISEWLVYHAWDANRTARRMCLDRLVWTKDGPRCSGPTTTPQPL